MTGFPRATTEDVLPQGPADWKGETTTSWPAGFDRVNATILMRYHPIGEGGDGRAVSVVTRDFLRGPVVALCFLPA